MSNTLNAPQAEVDRTVTSSLLDIIQDKATVLEGHILDRLATRHAFGRATDITEWGREVTLCGVKLGEKKGGPFRTEQTGVYPLKTAFTSFMKGLKEEMATVKDLGGRKPTPVQHDETVTKYHVQYINDNPFPPPSDGLGERETLLT
jgi:hypothetical protein